ncbi:phosphoribosyl-ATP pyrophosphatase [Tistrella bauzanensis]|uniref:Phosphoribosyl-ATP pyrophosphatase n=1 Tax=Tistrella bauzanensis TaxID=657419 RepID=A0ABQ1IPL9_9PROT|nr:phosphoribosyl-ATP diphosphatase [Tistrella bauzanensis]GGB46668.1 phosphoribosyl-ATP pyrophosphatase [Tistrella bauzanensis]
MAADTTKTVQTPASSTGFNAAGQTDWEVLERLVTTIRSRKGADPSSSYVAKLLGKGRLKMAQKVGEEAVEVAIAAVAQDKAALVDESADLLFHLMVLWADAGLDPADVMATLARREGRSGIEEKKNRKG